jgi:hypothetical protein
MTEGNARVIARAVNYGASLRYLLLRYGFVLLAYAGRPEEEASFPIAVACVALESVVRNAVLFIRDDWERRVQENHREYIEDTFQDWEELLSSSSGGIPPILLELSVGPFRTVEEGECDEQDISARVRALLRGSYRNNV